MADRRFKLVGTSSVLLVGSAWRTEAIDDSCFAVAGGIVVRRGGHIECRGPGGGSDTIFVVLEDADKDLTQGDRGKADAGAALCTFAEWQFLG